MKPTVENETHSRQQENASSERDSGADECDPLERILTVTRLAGYADTRLDDVWQGTWEQFCLEVVGNDGRGHQRWPGDKTKAPSFVPASFKVPAGWKPSEREKTPRIDKHIHEVHVAVFDYDDIATHELSKLRAFAKAHSLAACIYTTYNHVGGPIARCRFMLPLYQPVPGSQWETFWLAAASQLPAGKPDQKCKNPSRCYGLAYTPNLDDAFIEVIEGECALDVNAVLDSAPASAPVRSTTRETHTLHDVKADVLKKHYTKISRSPSASMQAVVAMVHALVEARPYAPSGDRHSALLTLTGHLERSFPAATLESLADLCNGSHRAMADGVDAEFGSADTAWKTALKALEGARAMRLETIAKRQAAEASDLQVRIAHAFQPTQPGRVTGYTEAEWASMASERGLTVEELRRLQVIQSGSNVFLFCDGDYRGPYGKDESDSAMYRDLAPAAACTASGVRLETRDEKTGKVVQRERREMIKDYGTVASKVVVSFVAQRSSYDATTRNFKQAVMPLRQLEPVHSVVVARWLELLAGELLPFLLTWIVLSRDLDQLLCALYLVGPPETGKNLVATAVARQWTTKGPTKAPDIMDANFNDAVTDSGPVIFADEYVPEAWKGSEGLSRFREFMSSRDRKLKVKFAHASHLEGCLRVILAGNNQELLTTHDKLTDDDRAAIAQRLFHLPVRKQAAEYLANLEKSEPGRIKRMVESEEIVKHFAWLAENHAVERDGRFGIKPPLGEVHQGLGHGAYEKALVQIYCRYMEAQDAEPWNATRRIAGLYIGDGILYGRNDALARAWDEYGPKKLPYDPGRAFAALKKFAIAYYDNGQPKKTYDGPVKNVILLDRNKMSARSEEDGGVPKDDFLAGVSRPRARATPSRLPVPTRVESDGSIAEVSDVQH